MSEEIKENETNPKKKKNVKYFFFLFVKILIALTILGIVAGIALFASVYSSTGEVNDYNFWAATNETNIYDRNDELIETVTAKDIDWIDLKDEDGNYNVSEYFMQGLVATEDAKFETHHGVDFIGMVKATMQTLLTNTSRGGSTLTMQLAKLVYMQDWLTDDNNNGEVDPGGTDGISKKSENPIQYKLTQMSYAFKIEKQYSKEEIMENYVNNAYFGQGTMGPIYGLENASQYYYGVSSKDLSLPQAAHLAGMPQSPNNYNPYSSPEAATRRRDVVLGRMLAEEYITQAEYDEAKKVAVTDGLVDHSADTYTSDVTNNGYIDLVYRELKEKFDPNEEDGFYPTTAGFNIYTNMDPELQKLSYDVTNSELYVDYQDDVDTGSATIDTQTGAVLAIGNGNEQQSYLGTNYGVNYTRQPGSTSKPIIDYGPAIEYLDWSTHHKVTDEEITYSDGVEIANADKEYMGDITLQEGLAKSRNTTALYTFQTVAEEVGVDKIIDFAIGLGISNIDEKEFNESYAIGGWNYGTTPLELAGAYAAFGNGGTYHKPSAIRYVEVNQYSPYHKEYGDRVEFMDEGSKAMEPSTAYLITKMLDTTTEDSEDYSAVAAPEGLEEHSAKSGTSNWGENSYDIPESAPRDKWMAGYTPNATTVVWTGMGQEEEKAGDYLEYDNLDSYDTYRQIMSGVRDSSEEYLHDDHYEIPDDVVEVKVDPETWPPQEDSDGESHYFIKDSKDYDELGDEVLEDNTESTDVAPTPFNFVINSDSITLSWEDNNSTDDEMAWNIYVDDKFIDQVKDTSYTITFDEMSSAAGCKGTYNIGLMTVKRTTKKYSEKVEQPIKFNDNGAFCGETALNSESGDSEFVNDNEKEKLPSINEIIEPEDSKSDDNNVTEPEVTEPEVSDPEVTELEVTKPEVTEPEVTEPEVTEPEVTEPEVTEPEVTEPDVTEPEVTEPEVTDPEVTEPEVTEPEVTEPEVTEPEVTEPEVTEPEESEKTEPEVTEPEEPGNQDNKE